jgi:benzodiazapine receptor
LDSSPEDSITRPLSKFQLAVHGLQALQPTGEAGTNLNKTEDLLTGRSWLALLGFIVLSFGVASLGGYWTSLSQPEWYDQLAKPSWTPPSWLFGPVWTALYLAMAVAAWRVWRQGGWARQRRPLMLFLVQLFLNLIWSGLFFGLRSPALGMLEIVLLWLAILLTLLAFRRADHLASWLFVPYLLWVTFAAALNFAIWRLNG